jgi:hypothetical protein
LRRASLGETGGCGTCTGLGSIVFWSAELGRQALLIQVETPKRGKIHICNAIHNTTTPTAMKISIFGTPRSINMLFDFLAQYSEYPNGTYTGP